MKHLSPSRPSRLAVGGAAAAGLALALSACSGGSGEAGKPAEQNGDGAEQAAEETSAPADTALKQLNEDEIADVLNGLTHDGKSFATFDVEPPAMQSAIEQFKQADVEPAACKDVLIELMTMPSADAPNKSALSDDNGYTAAIASFETNDDATTALQNIVDTNSTCHNMKMTVAGESIEMEMSVDFIDVPGAGQAVETITSSPMAPGTKQHTVSAVVKNGFVTGSAIHDSTTEKSVGITTELVKAYDEATS
ncbi:hypothetical protein [Brevibacterium gallinarum]|uniref:Lipoprotein n=1 Tax=Brevibacterium gallinarum TaxID=2762220 RepID=A0ABR8WTQ0_9MICO|nr:hypothetical protein [Brevibacterium gallinarum]MBD8020450.1 hypothetical protein [Brevibacterium gallinarum]